MEQPQVANTRRVAKDLGILIDAERKKEGIYAKTLDDKMNRIYMMLIGPDDTPYEGCLFFFTIDPAMMFASVVSETDGHKQYPYNPPRVLFHSSYSIRCHPNLYQMSTTCCGREKGGKVCLSILGTWPGPEWTPMMSFLTIAQTILSILDYEPLRNEPGFVKGRDETVQAYTKYVQYVCLRETLESVIKPVVLATLDNGGQKLEGFMEIFQEEIFDYFIQNKKKYEALLQKRAEEFDGTIIKAAGCYGNREYHGHLYDYGDLLERLPLLV